MKNLVLGSSGFIGKPFCKYLRDNGEEVIEFDIKEGKDARYEMLPISKDTKIYFLAWDVGGAKYLYSKDTQIQQLEWNLQLLCNVMPQLEKNNFVFVSSQLSENMYLSYGITKRLGEKWTELLNGTTVRLWNVYGAYEDLTNRSHVVSDFIHQAITTKQIVLMTNGKERRQFVHIDDLNHALYDIMEYLYGKFDITTGEWISIREIAEIIASFNNSEVIIGKNIGNDSEIEPKNIYKIENLTPIVEGLRKTYDLYLAHYKV